ncbi:MAG: ABC transporter permease [Phycisphaerales bacterium]|nr:MAG: ABC transporter permease [Phycisphaerales bacterium]
MNILLASVTERTRDIRIRRAIGAKRAQTIGQFLIETIVLSTTGGILGVAIGLAIPWTITHLAGMPAIATGYTLVLAVGISVTVGLVFGLYPARRGCQRAVTARRRLSTRVPALSTVRHRTASPHAETVGIHPPTPHSRSTLIKPPAGKDRMAVYCSIHVSKAHSTCVSRSPSLCPKLRSST